MRVLLDTCVLADLRKPDGHRAVKAAVALIPDDDLYISGLTLGEVARSFVVTVRVARSETCVPGLLGFRTTLPTESWESIMKQPSFGAKSSERTRHTGHLLHIVDGLLAATALCRGLHIMTRTTPSLAATGVLIVDPYADSATSQNT